MKLKTKLIMAFSAVGIIPLIVIGIIALNNASNALSKAAFDHLESVKQIKKIQIEEFFAERRGDMQVLVDIVSTLRKEAFNKLIAIRETKKAAIKRHFQLINNQIITFSENKMIVNAMREFSRTFRSFRNDNVISPENMKKIRSKLYTYYTNEFTVEYKKQNNGKSPNAERFFSQLDADSIALQYHYVYVNINPLGSKHLLDRAEDKSNYSDLHGKIHLIIRNFLDKFDYYDIFLVDSKTGDIVYSVFKELDFSTSLIDGPYAQTNIGEAFRRANAAGNKDTVMLVDYAQYTPSYEAAASFIASPIFDGNEKIGVAVFQMPVDRLNAIMEERAGLGETGETYLVGQDLLMRSNSYLDPKNHSVIASFKNPDKGKVDTQAAKSAVSGKTNAEVIIDYNGNSVLSAYTPVKIGDFTWGLLSEINVAEAFCPKDESGKYFFKEYKEAYGYYDLFMINPNGYCFYTVAKEADYQTNFVSGKYRNSNMGKLIRKVINTKKFGITDFEPYAPSNDEPAIFIAQPEIHNGKIEVIVALQISSEPINSIMQHREGMGKTGETYLVGNDKLMRSDSYLDPAGHSLKASFAGNVKNNGVDTVASNEALSGKTGKKILINYNGNLVLSAYTPLKIGTTIWALLAEIDEAEAFDAIKTIEWLVGVVAVIAITAVIVTAYLIAVVISKMTEKIDTSKTYVENIIKSMLDTLIVISPHGYIETVNKATCMTLGYEEKELIGQTFGKVIAEEEIFKGTKLAELVEEGSVVNMDVIYCAKDGYKIPMSLTGSAMRDKEGKFTGVVASARDMREIQEFIAELRTARIYSEGIVTTILSGLATLDEEGRILSTNPGFAVLFKGEQVAGMWLWDLVSSVELKIAVEKVLIEGGEVRNLEISQELRGSADITLSVSIADLRIEEDTKKKPLSVGKKEHRAKVLVVFDDITERKHLIQKLEHSIEELKRTQAQLVQSGKLSAVGELAAGVAHEINNPLTGVLTYAVLLKEKLERTTDTIRSQLPEFPEWLDLIKTAAERCKLIADNLLTFSRQSNADMSSIDLSDVISKTFELIGMQLRHKRIKLTCKIQEGLHAICGNASQLQQVFTNIVLNAVDAMVQGGEITVCVKSDDETCEVSISDTGPGMPREHLDRIFEPFFTTKPVGKGTGLGLSITYGIINDHGGKISVDSILGRGTTFVIKLPVRKAEDGN